MQAKILQTIFKHQFRFLSKEREIAIASQTALCKEMVDLAKDTVYGRKFQFNTIESISDFKKQLPIQSYTDLFPYIERTIAGEKDVLWYGRVKMFAKSSGTSNAKSKFIPLSKVSLEENHYKGGKNILSIYSHHFPDKNLFDGQNLSVAGSLEKQKKSKIGDLSALLLSSLPTWVQNRRLPSKTAALLPCWEEKIDIISKEVISQNIGSVSGVPSWNLILLQKILQKSNAKNLKEIWPNFKLYIHGGVNFAPYKKAFEDLIGQEDFTFLETYNASEGFFAIQDTFDQEENGMLLLCNHAVFYEFLEVKDKENPFAPTLQLNQVELNKNYALIITTKSGLWRYKIGDTIRFISLNPFRIVVSGRLKYHINVFGEELMEENTNTALERACKQMNCSFQEYTVAPIFPNSEGKGGHEWLIEFSEAPSNLEDFALLLDKELKNLNSDYEAKRISDLAMQLPIIKIVLPGTFFNWLKNKGKLGAQNKVPRLQGHREILEAVLASIDA